MAEGILGLGQGQAAGLNNDMIEKLKAVDRKATVEPIEKKLENFEPEREAISNISTKVDDFLNALKIFSLNQTTGASAFHQKNANVYGEGVIFDAEDVNSLKNGSMNVKVEQLAQKDVWQSGLFDGTTTTKNSLVDQGDLTINGTTINTDGKTYSDLVKEINKISGVDASLVENSAGGFRISIKSSETGEANKINMSGAAANSPFKADSTDEETLKIYNVLKAQDMELRADGVNYSSSSNTITIDGLKITATKEGGNSTIEISNYNTDLPKQMQEFANKYNEFKSAIENELYSSESSVYDKSSLRNMLETVKQELFGSGNSNSSLFSFGFSLDSKSGDLLFNQKEFEKATKDGTEELEKLFTGVPEQKGVATRLDEAITINGVKKGLIDYELNMMSREETLKKDKETAETALDTKYSLMAQQFAAYGVIINQMEASFSGLKMLIMQSQASK
ncbi:flagellar filament capping protein FliD [Aliarcobacter thereius]|uniref:Filament cap protein n=1 Tax=Aliarcobacter thereius LMG 24486 TaxID=1032240 RepID=A0A1C7WMM3_9BACT|nr:flagellar filament capping protein FliD [Aliarcobacter thereius]OCL94818.1 Flagellar hook-associated protein 2 [Aliarcobacter thereius LMG 24486]QBF15307.1 flagellar filament cap protein [Aliarcobacter thereius LMG 24486]TLS92045.1 flagellar hook protein FliD [Aliarcobacter thereius]